MPEYSSHEIELCPNKQKSLELVLEVGHTFYMLYTLHLQVPWSLISALLKNGDKKLKLT